MLWRIGIKAKNHNLIEFAILCRWRWVTVAGGSRSPEQKEQKLLELVETAYLAIDHNCSEQTVSTIRKWLHLSAAIQYCQNDWPVLAFGQLCKYDQLMKYAETERIQSQIFRLVNDRLMNKCRGKFVFFVMEDDHADLYEVFFKEMSKGTLDSTILKELKIIKDNAGLFKVYQKEQEYFSHSITLNQIEQYPKQLIPQIDKLQGSQKENSQSKCKELLNLIKRLKTIKASPKLSNAPIEESFTLYIQTLFTQIFKYIELCRKNKQALARKQMIRDAVKRGELPDGPDGVEVLLQKQEEYESEYRELVKIKRSMEAQFKTKIYRNVSQKQKEETLTKFQKKIEETKQQLNAIRAIRNRNVAEIVFNYLQHLCTAGEKLVKQMLSAIMWPS